MMEAQFSNQASEIRRQGITKVAVGILRGEIGLLEGSIQLAELGEQIGRQTNTTCFVSYPDEFHIFVVIASDADKFPLGESRKHWNPEALAERDKEKKEHELFYQEKAYEACRDLINKYKAAGEG